MSLDLNQATKYAIKKYAVAYMAMRNPMYERLDWLYRDRIKQGLLNNLFDYNPGELERWADDGGHSP